MVITDYTVIESAKPKFPELMTEKAEEAFIKAHYDLLEKKSRLASLRMEAMKLEQELQGEEKEYRKMAELFDITYSKKEFEEVRGQIYMGIINPDDYRNHS